MTNVTTAAIESAKILIQDLLANDEGVQVDNIDDITLDPHNDHKYWVKCGPMRCQVIVAEYGADNTTLGVSFTSDKDGIIWSSTQSETQQPLKPSLRPVRHRVAFDGSEL